MKFCISQQLKAGRYEFRCGVSFALGHYQVRNFGPAFSTYDESSSYLRKVVRK